jgi:hypothetical protein
MDVRTSSRLIAALLSASFSNEAREATAASGRGRRDDEEASEHEVPTSICQLAETRP